MRKFILSCESTVDMPYSYIVSERKIPAVCYTYRVDTDEYIDDMMKDSNSLPRFYSFIAQGKLPASSQLNQYTYEQFFDSLLPEGDLLHIVMSSGVTKSIQGAEQAAAVMRKKYPDRKIVIIDSLCASSGYGMLVDYAADLLDRGMELDAVADWLLSNRNKVHHQFFTHRLDFFRRSGRVSGSAAMIATILGICPIMRLDNEGKIIAYGKVRGKKNAIRRTVEEMEVHAENGADYAGRCFISHSDSMEEALMLRDAIAERFPKLNGKVRIFDIGPLVASNSGPGTVAVYFMGDERQPLTDK